MILILVIELSQVGFSGYALWCTWNRWCVAKRRRLAYQASKKNGLPGFANRLRETREYDRMMFQLNLLCCGIIFLGWRFANLERPIPVIPSLVFHYPFIYPVVWVFKQTYKDEQSEGELKDMTDHEDEAMQKRIAITDALQAGLDTANTKLDEMKATASGTDG